MKQFKFLPVLLLLGFILCSFGGVKTFHDTSWIPADFDCRKSTLLVQNIGIPGCMEQGEKQTRVVTEIMQAEYTYKYELAKPDDILNSSKYADKDVYRWALMTNGVYMKETMGTMSASGADFHIYDRKLNKHYKPTGKSDSFLKHVMAPTIATIVKYLNELGTASKPAGGSAR